MNMNARETRLIVASRARGDISTADRITTEFTFFVSLIAFDVAFFS